MSRCHMRDREQERIDKLINPPAVAADWLIHYTVMRNAVWVKTGDNIEIWQSDKPDRGFRKCRETQPRLFHVTKRYAQLRAKALGVWR